MAKCVKAIVGDKILRVPDKKADELVQSGKYKFCPKSEWKKKNK